jgi:predicted kinase
MTAAAEQPRLIVVRGNSGSGKSSVAKSLREAYGRGIAVVGQDNIRRTILRDRDLPESANIGLIGQVARYALENGFHVVVEGILDARRYGPMLTALRDAHRGPAHFYYLDVSLQETISRHATRPQAAEFGPDDMRDWYVRLDLIPSLSERIIGEASTLAETTALILAESGLLQAVLLKAEPATKSDLPSLLELAAQHDRMLGPPPDFAAAARHAIAGRTLLVVRDPREVVLGAALLSDHPGDHPIRWLAVRAGASHRRVRKLLLAEIVRRRPAGAAARSGVEVPEQAVVGDAFGIRIDAVGVEQDRIPAGAVVPLGAPGGHGEVGPAIGEPQLA